MDAVKHNNSSTIIHLFSDYSCPWCYVGELLTRKVASEWIRTHPAVSLVFKWLPYWLHPETPSGGESIYNILPKEILERHGSLLRNAARGMGLLESNPKAACQSDEACEVKISESIDIIGSNLLPRGIPNNIYQTLKALAFTVAARERLKDEEIVKKLVLELFRAYHNNLENVEENGVLINTAKRAGISDETAQQVLQDIEVRNSPAVRIARLSKREVNEIGIFSIPAFVIIEAPGGEKGVERSGCRAIGGVMPVKKMLAWLEMLI